MQTGNSLVNKSPVPSWPWSFLPIARTDPSANKENSCSEEEELKTFSTSEPRSTLCTVGKPLGVFAVALSQSLQPANSSWPEDTIGCDVDPTLTLATVGAEVSTPFDSSRKFSKTLFILFTTHLLDCKLLTVLAPILQRGCSVSNLPPKGLRTKSLVWPALFTLTGFTAS